MAQVFSCEFCEISKNTFFYRTPLVAAFGYQTWFKCDITIMEVSKIDAVTSKSGLSRIIQGPTLALNKATSSNELVFEVDRNQI